MPSSDRFRLSMVFYPTDPEIARDDVVPNLHNIVLRIHSTTTPQNQSALTNALSLLWKSQIVCHPERSEAESKDLGTELTASDNEMRRSLDSLRSLGMTTFLLFLTDS